MSPKVLSVIPARSGSKGLPNKNIKMCGGKPLIEWTIEASLNSTHITDTLVSTNSPEIKCIAEKSGAWVPFLREEKLSQDDSDIVDVVVDALHKAQGINGQYDFIILLQPTAPLRTSQDIDASFEAYMQNKKNTHDTLISVTKVDSKFLWILGIDENAKYLYSHFDIDLTKPRRQKLQDCYLPNGAIYLASTEDFTGFYSGHSIPFVMDTDKSVDIDYLDDLVKVEDLMKKMGMSLSHES